MQGSNSYTRQLCSTLISAQKGMLLHVFRAKAEPISLVSELLISVAYCKTVSIKITYTNKQMLLACVLFDSGLGWGGGSLCHGGRTGGAVVRCPVCFISKMLKCVVL